MFWFLLFALVGVITCVWLYVLYTLNRDPEEEIDMETRLRWLENKVDQLSKEVGRIENDLTKIYWRLEKLENNRGSE